MGENLIKTIQTDYIKPSKTIETILISNGKIEKIVYLYNYEGVIFTLFLNLLELFNFLNDRNSEFQSFENENNLDDFLLNVNIE